MRITHGGSFLFRSMNRLTFSTWTTPSPKFSPFPVYPGMSTLYSGAGILWSTTTKSDVASAAPDGDWV